METKKHAISMGMLALVGVLAVVLITTLIVGRVPSTALAYYNFGTVQISPGTYSLSVAAGQSTSTSVSVSPASDMQTPGCGMAKCPQVCDSAEAYEAGYNCFDANGNCTCAGSQYDQYTTQVSASSSNSAVATASVSGGTLTVTGHSAGSATITVNASLRQWTSNSVSIQVDVAKGDNSDGNNNNNNNNNSDNNNSDNSDKRDNNDNSKKNDNSSNSDTSKKTDTHVVIPDEAVVSESRDDALNETVIETVAGKVYMVEINSYLDTKEQLQRVQGSEDQVVFWSGTASDKPSYSWTFYGKDIPEDSPYFSFDPSVSISKMGEEYVANLMKQAKDGVVLACAYTGTLPSSASFYAYVGNDYADNTNLSLFVYNDEKRCFELVQENLEVEAGYAHFQTEQASLWALSTDNLAQYSVEETYTPLAVANQDTTQMQKTTNWVVVVAGIAAAVALVVAACVVIRRRKHLVADALALNEQELSEKKAESQTLNEQELSELHEQESTEQKR